MLEEQKLKIKEEKKNKAEAATASKEEKKGQRTHQLLTHPKRNLGGVTRIINRRE